MGIIISLGGGAVTRKPNVDAIKAGGKVVLLDSGFDVCYERISGDSNRPIVMKKTKEQISYYMQRAKNKDSSIELILRSELWSKGLCYRKNVAKIISKQDIAFL